MSERSSLMTRPLPLKQRTSSLDPRRDFSSQTWTSLLGLVKPREYLVTVDNFSIWRRHLAWAMENGGDLRSYMTQRYASSMVFMSLLLGAELSVLFNASGVITNMRRELFAENHWSVEFWAGVTICMSVILTILSLMSTFTAWGMVSSVSDSNAHCIFRSSIGQYIADLPGRFIVTAVYSFFIWVTLFFFILLPLGFWSIMLAVITVTLFVHVVTVFSAFGRIIMHTGAMGSQRIFDEEEERRLLPHGLHASLLDKANERLGSKMSITRQYRRRIRKSTIASSFRFSDYDENPNQPTSTVAESRPRADSAVRFGDQLWTSDYPRGNNPTTPDNDVGSRREGGTAQSLQSTKSGYATRPPRPVPFRIALAERSNTDSTSSSEGIKQWLQADNTRGSAPPTQRNGSTDKHKRPFVECSQSSSTKENESSPCAANETTGHDVRTTLQQSPWRPPTMINYSAIRRWTHWDERELTEEEKFDLEYAEMSPLEEADDSASDEYEGSPLGLHPSEAQHLLANDGDIYPSYATVPR